MKELRINLSEMAHKIQEDVKNLVKGFSEMDIAAYAMGRWIPQADVFEGKEEIRILIDLPGLAPGRVEVSLTGNQLKVAGEKPALETSEGFRPMQTERRAGSFSRTFILHVMVDPDRVSASLKDGMLDIHLPKRPESVEREIKVEVK